MSSVSIMLNLYLYLHPFVAGDFACCSRFATSLQKQLFERIQQSNKRSCSNWSGKFVPWIHSCQECEQPDKQGTSFFTFEMNWFSYLLKWRVWTLANYTVNHWHPQVMLEKTNLQLKPCFTLLVCFQNAYTKAGEEMRHDFTLPVDTPEMNRAKESAKNASDVSIIELINQKETCPVFFLTH